MQGHKKSWRYDYSSARDARDARDAWELTDVMNIQILNIHHIKTNKITFNTIIFTKNEIF